ncbi:MAG: sugar phosphate isomerase/epimerase [Verrucomicrobia bacterium]|nr:sugar phosphate isomerase/epimerase [Verrucomicrobiota bacterium]
MKFFTLSLAASVALLGLQTIPAFAGSYQGPTGLQLYSLRADFAKDVPGTMKFVKDLGFHEVEVGNTYKLTPVEFKKLLDANNLKPIAGHFPYDRLRNDPEGVAQEAKVYGLKYVGCAWIPHKGNFDEAQCRAAAEVFNKAGAVFAKHGMKCFYHVHGYEFRPLGDGTVFDLLMAQTDPKLVTFEMDILWVMFPGQCPVKLFEKYGKRWELVHLKDLKKGVKTGEHTGHTDVTNDVPLGSGQMDYSAILKAAQKAGVKYYFIEDESPSVREQLPQSLKFLQQVKW